MGVVFSVPPGYLLAHTKTPNDTLCRRCGSWNVVCSLGHVRLELRVLSRLRLIFYIFVLCPELVFLFHIELYITIMRALSAQISACFIYPAD